MECLYFLTADDADFADEKVDAREYNLRHLRHLRFQIK